MLNKFAELITYTFKMNKLLLAFICIFSLQGWAQDLKPYLQAATSKSIYINWKTSSNPESIVEFGTSRTNLSETVNGTNQIFSDVGYNANYYYHTVKLTNLQPNTKYYYRVKTGKETSEVMSFKTMPLPGQAATTDGHLRFLVLGDNQMRNVPRFDTLVSQAKRNIEKKWGKQLDPSDNVTMTVMVGDQVDVGTLDHYENVHLKKNQGLSGLLPIQTLVGNHETYGTLGMKAYYDHFVLDEMVYQGISSGTEDYYANQVGNVLFIALDTEHTSAKQLNWVIQVINAANSDKTVDWIVSLGHRPYQAEQYIGDISTWVRNTVMPKLTASPKHILHIGAHHHLYHRGQLKNSPTYQIISGGVAWDQYWGMAVEEDYEDVQKTIPNWAYQIIDVDVKNGTFDVETYSMGSAFQWKDNALIDKFYHKKGKSAPNKPSITTTLNGQNISLPLTLEASPYNTATDELLNSTEYLIGKNNDFSVIERSVYRDFENLYGPLDGKVDESKDINKGIDITKLTIGANEIPNGEYFVKYRQRDRNLNWSDWSDVKSFKVINSNFVDAEISLDSAAYAVNAPIDVHFTGGPGNQTDWIGLYKSNQTPGASSPSKVWKYTNGATNGTITFDKGLTEKGLYYATFLENGGYKELTDRKSFYVGPEVSISTDKEIYSSGSSVDVTFSNGPKLAGDWIGIYKVSHTPSVQNSTQWQYVTTENGTINFKGLADGYYFVAYLLEGGYHIAGEKAFFQVGELITNLVTDKTVYNLNENIIATWSDAPGIPKDWLGIYHEGDNPNVDELISYTYFEGQTEGSIEIPNENMPQEIGNYFVVMFTNDSYNEVSNRVEFEVIESTAGIDEFASSSGVTVYPNPSKNGEHTYIKSKYPISQIDMFDLTGNLFYSTKNINDYNFSLINQNLPTGVYILRIHSNKLYNVKIIIK